MKSKRIIFIIVLLLILAYFALVAALFLGASSGAGDELRETGSFAAANAGRTALQT